MKVPVTNIQRYCMHDGPGIRTTVFLKGCPLSCKWCHNPETQKVEQEMFYTPSKCIGCKMCMACENKAHIFTSKEHIYDRGKCCLCGMCATKCPSGALETVSQLMSIDEIISVVIKDAAFYGEKGGITISGGEPMMHPKETIELLKAAKKNNLTTAIETSGYFNKEFLPSLCEYTDTFLWDYKDSDNSRHIKNTGVSNEKIIENLRIADELNANIVLKCILINSINFTEEHIKKVADLYMQLNNCNKVEFFSYHPFGSSKSERLGCVNKGRKDWRVSDEDINWAKSEFFRYIKTHKAISN